MRIILLVFFIIIIGIDKSQASGEYDEPRLCRVKATSDITNSVGKKIGTLDPQEIILCDFTASHGNSNNISLSFYTLNVNNGKKTALGNAQANFDKRALEKLNFNKWSHEKHSEYDYVKPMNIVLSTVTPVGNDGHKVSPTKCHMPADGQKKCFNMSDKKHPPVLRPLGMKLVSTDGRDYEAIYKVNSEFESDGEVFSDYEHWVKGDLKEASLLHTEYDAESPSNGKICDETSVVELKKILNLTTESLRDKEQANINFLYKQLGPFLGHCIKDNRGKKPLAAINSYWDKQGKVYESQNKKGRAFLKDLARDDVRAVDTIARSLCGEMRGTDITHMRGVARALYNRALFVKIYNSDKEKWIQTQGFVANASLVKELKNGKGSVADYLPHVAVNSSQIDTWKKKDANYKYSMCPKQAEPNSEEAWKRCVFVASEVLFDNEKFLEKTKQITSFHYTSGKAKIYGLTKSLGSSLYIGGQAVSSRKTNFWWPNPKDKSLIQFLKKRPNPKSWRWTENNSVIEQLHFVAVVDKN